MKDRRPRRGERRGLATRATPGSALPYPVLSLDDAAVAHLVTTEDPRAGATLWLKYAALVRGLLRRTLGPCADVEDLVHDAFIGLFRTLPGLRDPEALRSFVVGTALRVARSELRRRRVRRCLSLTATGSIPDAVQPGASDPEARRALMRLYEMLAKVDPRGRIAFVRRHLEGCDLGEVAETLSCSVATAKRVLARAEDRVYAMVRRDPLLAAYARAGANGGGEGDADERREEVMDAAE